MAGRERESLLFKRGMLRERERERERELLFERVPEHLCLRQLIHGIGGGPR